MCDRLHSSPNNSKFGGGGLSPPSILLGAQGATKVSSLSDSVDSCSAYYNGASKGPLKSNIQHNSQNLQWWGPRLADFVRGQLLSCHVKFIRIVVF